ncbi:autoinducer binding domain-containing protein [Maritalea sp.]|uniref:helix-turn-helix transcriptional regulator n=1 Tax=Maritalea sp. TaxID=2003361 RepID=UPI003EF51C5D
MLNQLACEFIEGLQAQSSQSQIWAHSAKFFAQFGFEGIVYLDQKGDDVNFMSSLPDYWVEHYRDQNYHLIDPFVPVCCAQFETILTGVTFMDRHKSMTSAQRNFVREAGETGFISGFSVPFRKIGKEGAGGWNFLSDKSGGDTIALHNQHGSTIELASFCAHQAISRAKKSADHSQLSPREIETLQWLSKGLRSQQIAHKMNVKQVTIEFHFRNARQKLGAATREQALAIALAQNLIQP